MKITKYEHSCLVIEEEGDTLVVDPGELANLPELNSVLAVFITHIHGDHLDISNIRTLVKSNPKLKLIGAQEVLDELKEFSQEKILANSDDVLLIGKFEIIVGGNEHAIIYKNSPCLNRSLLVNKKFYYPGDSFTKPSTEVELVAVPASAPWLKTSESMEFIKEVGAKKVFPIHNGLLSEFGEATTYRWMTLAAEEVGTEFVFLKPREAIEV